MWGIIIAIGILGVGAALVFNATSRGTDNKLLVSAAVVSAILACQIVLVAYDVMAQVPPPNWGEPWLVANFIFAVEIGLLVGATELIARYRDEPFAPLLSVPGVFYVLINGGASALAYYLLVLLEADIEEPLRTFTAGVAAMAFFRSALFNVRLGGQDVPVGPNLILLTLLRALDRTYDRERAAPRSKLLKRIVGHLKFERVKNSLPTLCTDLMQNLTQEETDDLNRQVTNLSQSTEMDDRSKMLSLGLALLDIVGEKTLKAAVDTLGTFSRVDESLLLQLGAPEPEIVLDSLPTICATLFETAPHDPDQKAFDPPPLPPSLSLESKVVLLVYQLVNYYGVELVAVAANLVQGSAEAAEPEDPQEPDPPVPPAEPAGPDEPEAPEDPRP